MERVQFNVFAQCPSMMPPDMALLPPHWAMLPSHMLMAMMSQQMAKMPAHQVMPAHMLMPAHKPMPAHEPMPAHMPMAAHKPMPSHMIVPAHMASSHVQPSVLPELLNTSLGAQDYILTGTGLSQGSLPPFLGFGYNMSSTVTAPQSAQITKPKATGTMPDSQHFGGSSQLNLGYKMLPVTPTTQIQRQIPATTMPSLPNNGIFGKRCEYDVLSKVTTTQTQSQILTLTSKNIPNLQSSGTVPSRILGRKKVTRVTKIPKDTAISNLKNSGISASLSLGHKKKIPMVVKRAILSQTPTEPKTTEKEMTIPNLESFSPFFGLNTPSQTPTKTTEHPPSETTTQPTLLPSIQNLQHFEESSKSRLSLTPNPTPPPTLTPPPESIKTIKLEIDVAKIDKSEMDTTIIPELIPEEIEALVQRDMRRFRKQIEDEGNHYIEQMLFKNPIIVERRQGKSPLKDKMKKEAGSIIDDNEDILDGNDNPAFEKTRAEQCRQSRYKNKMKSSTRHFRHQFLKSQMPERCGILHHMHTIIYKIEDQLRELGYCPATIDQMRLAFGIDKPQVELEQELDDSLEMETEENEI